MSSRFLSVGRTPVNWRFGAIGAGVALTQGLGYLWYSPNALGSLWHKEFPPAIQTQSSEEKQISFVLNTVSDAGLAVLLHYLTDRYFRPLTLQDAIFFAAVLGLAQTLPQIPHVLHAKRNWNGFLIHQAYNVLGIFIKILCIQHIPY